MKSLFRFEQRRRKRSISKSRRRQWAWGEAPAWWSQKSRQSRWITVKCTFFWYFTSSCSKCLLMCREISANFRQELGNWLRSTRFLPRNSIGSQKNKPFFRWDIRSCCQNLIWKTGRKQNLQSQLLRLFLEKMICFDSSFFSFSNTFFQHL